MALSMVVGCCFGVLVLWYWGVVGETDVRRDWCGFGFGIGVVEKNVTGASGVLEILVLVLVLVGFALKCSLVYMKHW